MANNHATRTVKLNPSELVSEGMLDEICNPDIDAYFNVFLTPTQLKYVMDKIDENKFTFKACIGIGSRREALQYNENADHGIHIGIEIPYNEALRITERFVDNSRFDMLVARVKDVDKIRILHCMDKKKPTIVIGENIWLT